ncbi:hypothetical protein MNAN1_000948 [Malassezia nana]|uniref:Tyrosyl-DNA phosphodiesterase 1 n=1 Tax=Malassezia nana TaxID=180528 RepID=A0AAF0J6F2_9BASI|nr:hypothetical protein MNAN1_000948 [Malassezia nana]
MTPGDERLEPTPSLLQLVPDRQQLERERLARAAARDRSRNTKKRARSPSPTASSKWPERASIATSSRYTPPQPDERFWTGTIKATYNRYARAARAGTKLEQLLAPTTRHDPHGLQRVFLASYDVDIDWLESLFPSPVPVTYVGHSPPGDGAPTPGFYASDTLPHWEMGVPRKPHARALQHVKLVLLFYPTHLRVLISSGNLTPLDWSRYENLVYVQDFPSEAHAVSLPPPDARSSGPAFRTQLERVLTSLSVPETHPIMRALRSYSFAHATAHLVASWPLAPVARGWAAVEQVGLGRLAYLVRQWGMTPSPVMHLEAQGSSLSAYDRRWLEQFYLIATGADSSVLPLPTRRGDGPSPDWVRATGIHGWPPVRILFPTQRWIEQESVEGPRGGGCFFGRADEFHKRSLRPLMAQPVSHRGHILIHAKSLLCINETAPDQGWVYMGSHNFTRAAWGTLSGTHEEPTLSLSNWELGVAMPLSLVEWGSHPMDAVPYRRPVQPYGEDDAPWDAQTCLW